MLLNVNDVPGLRVVAPALANVLLGCYYELGVTHLLGNFALEVEGICCEVENKWGNQWVESEIFEG